VTARLLHYGCYEVSLGDTTGEGNPEVWSTLWAAAEKKQLPMSRIAVRKIVIPESEANVISPFIGACQYKHLCLTLLTISSAMTPSRWRCPPSWLSFLEACKL